MKKVSWQQYKSPAIKYSSQYGDVINCDCGDSNCSKWYAQTPFTNRFIGEFKSDTDAKKFLEKQWKYEQSYRDSQFKKLRDAAKEYNCDIIS